MRNVLVIGDANVDIIVPYPRVIAAGDKTRVMYPHITMQGGGTAANTAVSLSRLGVPVSFVGTVGDDQYGTFVVNDLQNEGVDTSYISVRSDLNTVGVFAFVDESGERYLWGWPRERQAFKELDSSSDDDDTLASASWVHSSGMCLAYESSSRESIIRIFKKAHALGIVTSFDLNLRLDGEEIGSDFAQALSELLPFVNHLFGNGPEEFSYLGAGDWIQNVSELTRTVDYVIARNGEQGCIGFHNGQEYRISSFPVTVMDTIGAGDAFNAGYISAFTDGSSFQQALVQGNAVAAMTVGGVGARSSPTRNELAKFYTKMNETDDIER